MRTLDDSIYWHRLGNEAYQQNKSFADYLSLGPSDADEYFFDMGYENAKAERERRESIDIMAEIVKDSEV